MPRRNVLSLVKGSYNMMHLAPDYVYTSTGLQSNLLISISDDGRISSLTSRDPQNAHAGAIGSAQKIAPSNAANEIPLPQDTQTLPGIALLPGFINVHSHVFQ